MVSALVFTNFVCVYSHTRRDSGRSYVFPSTTKSSGKKSLVYSPASSLRSQSSAPTSGGSSTSGRSLYKPYTPYHPYQTPVVPKAPRITIYRSTSKKTSSPSTIKDLPRLPQRLPHHSPSPFSPSSPLRSLDIPPPIPAVSPPPRVEKATQPLLPTQPLVLAYKDLPSRQKVRRDDRRESVQKFRSAPVILPGYHADAGYIV